VCLAQSILLSWLFLYQATKEHAIDPLVQECIDSLASMAYASDIANFRQRAVALAADSAERQFIQSQLHQPTLHLRKGQHVDETKFLGDLSFQLATRRQEANSFTTP
jgi:hypothetical protein